MLALGVSLVLGMFFLVQGVASAEDGSGVIAKKHLIELSGNIKARVQGSEAELKAINYSAEVLRGLGYPTSIQVFKIKAENGNLLDSHNVVALKEGVLEKEVVVCAHVDSKVNTSWGADDNASGVSVLLEAAERLKNVQTPYTIRFVVLGSEETLFEKGESLQGAAHYVQMMGRAQIADTVGVVNLDSLIAGDFMYAHGDLGEKGVMRDLSLKLAKDLGYNLVIQLGENPEYPVGTTGDWGDHAVFSKKGIQYLNFEASNWHLGDKDGYQQTDAVYGVKGEFWHTVYDNMTDIEKAFPGRIDEHLSGFSDVLTGLLLSYGKDQLPKQETP